VIELVSTTGARDLAVLIYQSAELDDTAFAPHEAASARVYGLAVRIAPSPTPAMEVVGDSGTEVWRVSTRFDADRNSAIAWIMAIAHRRAVDRLRSTCDTPPSPLTPLQPLGRRARRHAHQDRHARHDQATHAEAAQVREALARLSPDQREALELAYFERYSDAQSADLATIMSTIVTTRLPAEPVRTGPDGPLEWPPDRETS
jgi:RNA polymerase sigma-70 factor (ECF subfamily)